MRVAILSSEALPFAKTGGLADVIGTLSVALERLGQEVCIIAPAYRSVLQGEFSLRETAIELSVPISDRLMKATVLDSTLDQGVAVHFIRADPYFDREFLYGTVEGDYPDNAERFIFFSRAALEWLRHQAVDIVHCHDWQTALVIVYLKTQAARYAETAAAKTVFTIHNLAFQGIFGRHAWHLLNLDSALFTPQLLEFYGNINFLKGALVIADKITTVSPSYAQEMMTAAQGFGLDGLVRQRAADLIGILNGVDYGQWSPWTDPFITCHYGENSLSAKEECKRSLRRTVGLPDKSDTPVVAMISRLTSQKGFDLVESIFASLMQRDIQFVLLGAGESRYEQFFRGAASRHPDRVGLRFGFDEPLAHQIEAGADIFLMPSLFEPCGLNQMFSLKYGTIPIVRAVGGLKDTVQQCNTEAETGTGFVFEPYEAQALLRTIDQSLQVFHDKKAWAALRRRAMAMDFSWERSAKRYAHLYRQLLN